MGFPNGLYIDATIVNTPFDYLNPDFNPAAASVAIGGASFNNPKLTSGFTQVDYKGACAIGDTWWKGWTLL